MIRLSVKKDKQATSRYCRVLGNFSKYYNKRFVEFEIHKQVVFYPQGGTQKAYSKRYKLLTRIMKLTKPNLEEVKLKKDDE